MLRRKIRKGASFLCYVQLTLITVSFTAVKYDLIANAEILYLCDCTIGGFFIRQEATEVNVDNRRFY